MSIGPALGTRAMCVIVISFGVLAMHGLTSVGEEHDAPVTAHGAMSVVDNVVHLPSTHQDRGMSAGMSMLASCIWILVASVGVLGIGRAYARLRTGCGAVVAQVRTGLADFPSRSPPAHPRPAQFVVLLT